LNEVLELWSLPWHALQHSLAEAFGVEAPTAAPPGRVRVASGLRADDGVSASEEPLSWLARAHLQPRQTIP